MHQPEVASYAIQNHIPLFQPEKIERSSRSVQQGHLFR
jgi:methionyl-tRNA formyltransferase